MTVNNFDNDTNLPYHQNNTIKQNITTFLYWNLFILINNMTQHLITQCSIRIHFHQLKNKTILTLTFIKLFRFFFHLIFSKFACHFSCTTKISSCFLHHFFFPVQKSSLTQRLSQGAFLLRSSISNRLC